MQTQAFQQPAEAPSKFDGGALLNFVASEFLLQTKTVPSLSQWVTRQTRMVVRETLSDTHFNPTVWNGEPAQGHGFLHLALHIDMYAKP